MDPNQRTLPFGGYSRGRGSRRAARDANTSIELMNKYSFGGRPTGANSRSARVK